MLDQQPVGPGTLNQKALSWVMAGRGRGGRAGAAALRRQVLEDAEAHGGHRLAWVEQRLHLVVGHPPRTSASGTAT